MFFYLSKVFGFFVQPLNFSILLLAAGLLAIFLGWRRTGLTLEIAAAAILILSAWTSLGAVLLNPLEERFARPANLPVAVDGVVVLGGGFEGAVNLARGGYELNSGGDRFVEAAPFLPAAIRGQKSSSRAAPARWSWKARATPIRRRGC
jgi:uncharacterized SAM-binding protein YcdF (DUF218 family)